MSTVTDILKAVREHGVVLHVDVDRLVAEPQGMLPEPVKVAIKGRRTEIIRRLTELRESFYVVMTAFRTPPGEIELCWRIALADLDAAEAAFHADAAMIRAGWKPLEEHAAQSLARKGLAAGQ